MKNYSKNTLTILPMIVLIEHISVMNIVICSINKVEVEVCKINDFKQPV